MTPAEQSLQASTLRDANQLIQYSPYARLIGMQVVHIGKQMMFVLPPIKSNIGNPSLPAIHGGCIAGFMENAARLHVLASDAFDFENGQPLPRVVNFSLDYLRPGRLLYTYASCRVERQGRKVVNVSVKAWQTNYQEPIARARTQLLL